MSPIAALLGAALTILSAYALGNVALRGKTAPPEVHLAVGAVIESLLVFALLLANAATWQAFVATAVCSAAVAWKAGLRPPGRPEIRPALLLAPFGVWYLVNALAPETTPDGITYHLGLAREYLRLA